MKAVQSVKSAPKALVVIMVILVASFGFYYAVSSSNASSLNQTVSSQSSLLSSQAAQLATDEGRIANLNTTVATLRSQVKNLQSELKTDQENITALMAIKTNDTSKINSLNSTVTSLNSQVSDLNTEISSLNNRITGYVSQIASLQVQVNNLRNVMVAINAALAEPSGHLLYSNDKISVKAGSNFSFTFQSQPDGGVMLVAVLSSTSSNTTVSAVANDAPMSVGSSGIVPYSPEGDTSCTIFIYDLNHQAFSATINVWYFY